MALQEMKFTFKSNGTNTISSDWHHTGVVGSGDMEVLMRHRELSGAVTAKVVTSVKGFEKVWEKVLGKFVRETGLSDVEMEINDDNATPYIVALRMKQALREAKEAE